MYKYLNQEKTHVRFLEDSSEIYSGGKGWGAFLAYVAGGGEVEPWKTALELLAEAVAGKIADLETEKNKRADGLAGTGKARTKTKMVARMVKLLRKEVKGNASPAEIAELDASQELDDAMDAVYAAAKTAEEWLADNQRTLTDIDNYDVVTDPAWP